MVTGVNRSSECGVQVSDIALTTHWREGRAGKSCKRSLRITDSMFKIRRKESSGMNNLPPKKPLVHFCKRFLMFTSSSKTNYDYF